MEKAVVKCGFIPSPTSRWALAVVATFHLSWNKSIKGQRQWNAATKGKELGGGGVGLGGWIAPGSISAGEASHPLKASRNPEGNKTAGVRSPWRRGTHQGEISSGPASPRCWVRPFCVGPAAGAPHTSTFVTRRSCTWMGRWGSESSSNLPGGPTANVSGLKSDARILLRLCIPPMKNGDCCLPSPQVLPGETVSQNEKHVGIACFTDTCSSRPHRTLL